MSPFPSVFFGRRFPHRALNLVLLCCTVNIARAQPPDPVPAAIPAIIDEGAVTNPGAGLADKTDYADWRALKARGQKLEKTDAPAALTLYREFADHPLLTP